MNMRRSILISALTAAVACAPAFAADNNSKRSMLDKADRTFVENAAHGGFAEIEGSKLAERKGQSADVKAFAATMIKDHSAVNQELATLAKSKGYTPPVEPSVLQRAEIKTLSALSGNTFDKAYVDRIGVAAHESTIKHFETGSREVKDQDIKAFIDKTLPSLRHHLELAKALNEKQKAQ